MSNKSLNKFIVDMDSIEETLNSVNGKKKTFEKDTRQFRPTVKNDKKEYVATIRFLPQGIPVKGESKPYFVERWSHSFTENGQWYFENCPSLVNKTLGTKDHICPVCEANRADYNSKQDVLIARAKSRKVKKTFATNILVIDDPQCPENNGKVMYWNMGAEILKMIEARWKPAKRAKSNPYCVVKGYDLELILKFNPTSGYPTYSGSEWLDERSLADSEEEIIKILSQTIDLSEFGASPAILKPLDELKKRFVKVTSGGIIVESPVSTVFAEDATPYSNIRSSITTKAPVALEALVDTNIPTLDPSTTEEGDDSWLD